jgi:DNA-binding response OmpR family regulator
MHKLDGTADQQPGSSRSTGEVRGRLAPLILVADDDTDSRLAMRASLEEGGYDVVEARDGPGAVDAFAARHPDLVVLDVMMPGHDGFSVAKWMREWPATAKVPIVMLTGRGDVETRARAASVGAGDYVVKPFEVDDLVRRLRAQLQPQGRAA